MPVITVEIATRTASQVKAPIIQRLIKDHDVVVNIRRAQVTDDYGQMVVDIEGSLEEVQRAVSWLHTTGLDVRAEQRSVGNDTANL
jgi:ABC-type methionine transport system ATPase subunit